MMLWNRPNVKKKKLGEKINKLSKKNMMQV